MERSYSPAVIPTFADGESMDDVRVKTINPLTAEANKLGIKMNSLSNTVISHANKISALEAGGGGGSGGSVDLGPITTRVTNAERDIDNLEDGHATLNLDSTTMKGQIVALQTEDTAIKGRVSALEAGGGSGGATAFTGLSDTPATLVANSYIKVNSAGDALEYQDEQFLTARSYIDSINIYGDFYIGPSGVFAKDKVASATYLMASSGSSPSCVMPDIVARNAMPTNEQVRSGRVMYAVAFNNPFRLIKPTATAQKFFFKGTLVDEIILAAGENVTLYAMGNGSFTHYIAIGGHLA